MNPVHSPPTAYFSKMAEPEETWICLEFIYHDLFIYTSASPKVNFLLTHDRDRLHDGVIRDVERQQRRKTENIYLLQQQLELTRQLRKSEDEQLQNSESAG
ncbi:uncharacterized protein LOC117282614 [Cryptotermes secundus]|uniref:uncharacterized protein LOC117282614 n=1 Tax=Cryptotermes secundus TaxID=105785 RepID=UPI001454D19B|nr:uncharacterized protein LOC117282614 [Cryptotermes secundus]